MKKINFIFVGPSKTASTWIYQALNESPDFSLPKTKDIYYFDQFYEKGDVWYEQQFKDCISDKIIGEFSHDYLISEQALERIKSDCPYIKLIVCLRDPYERTESGIKFLQRNGYGFGKVKDLITRHTELINGSLYGKNLKRLYQHFNKSNVLLLDYRKLSENPSAFLMDIYNFFDVEYFEPSILKNKVNKAKSARSKHLSYLVKRSAILARTLGFGHLVGILKMHPVVNKLLYKKTGQSFSLSSEDITLLSTYFDSDISLLESLTEQNFDAWRK